MIRTYPKIFLMSCENRALISKLSSCRVNAAICLWLRDSSLRNVDHTDVLPVQLNLHKRQHINHPVWKQIATICTLRSRTKPGSQFMTRDFSFYKLKMLIYWEFQLWGNGNKIFQIHTSSWVPGRLWVDDLLQTADISFPKQFTWQSRLFDIIFWRLSS